MNLGRQHLLSYYYSSYYCRSLDFIIVLAFGLNLNLLDSAIVIIVDAVSMRGLGSGKCVDLDLIYYLDFPKDFGCCT